MLKDLKLSENEQGELKDKLDSWKAAERKKIENDLTDRYEQMEAQLKEEYETLVEEIKENMKKVYTKRFTKALKEMYEEIKAEVMVESLHSPESKALEEVKATVYPLINEPTARRHKNEFSKLANMYESLLKEFEILKGANKKSTLVSSLSPDVRKVVDKLIGEGTEEEIVEKFATIKRALKEEVSQPSAPQMNESMDDDDDEPAPEIRVRRSVREQAPVRRPAPVRTENRASSEFESLLNEQLVLAGIKKQPR